MKQTLFQHPWPAQPRTAGYHYSTEDCLVLEWTINLLGAQFEKATFSGGPYLLMVLSKSRFELASTLIRLLSGRNFQI